MLGVASIALIAVPAAADARSQMRAVGSSTVYPFAKMVAERVARANPKLGTPIIESTGTGGGMKLFCSGVGARFPDIANAWRRMKASEAKLCAANCVTSITEIQVGLDGFAVATGRSSAFTLLTQRDIYLAIAKAPFRASRSTACSRRTSRSAPCKIHLPDRCSSTSRTHMPRRSRRFASSSPNSPRKVR